MEQVILRKGGNEPDKFWAGCHAKVQWVHDRKKAERYEDVFAAQREVFLIGQTLGDHSLPLHVVPENYVAFSPSIYVQSVSVTCPYCKQQVEPTMGDPRDNSFVCPWCFEDFRVGQQPQILFKVTT